MTDQTITLLLRLIHILAGIFWVGTIFLVAGFLLPVFLGIAMVLTVLSGFTMYGRLVAATNGAWASTPPAMAYGAGGLAAILGALVGALVSGRAARRMAAIGQSAAQKGGPSAEEQAQMERLQGRMALGSRLVAGFLAFSAVPLRWVSR